MGLIIILTFPLEFCKVFQEELQDIELIIGHNIKFDVDFIRRLFSRNNIEFPDVKLCCTMQKRRIKLQSLYVELFNKEIPTNIQLHTALNDARITFECARELYKNNSLSY